MGFGWGVCLRGAGTTNYLVRAVRIDDEEWGMTEFAQLVAETLDQSLGPHSDFHERAQGLDDAEEGLPPPPEKKRKSYARWRPGLAGTLLDHAQHHFS